MDKPDLTLLYVLGMVAGLTATCYLGIEGYAWHWAPGAVFVCWLAFVLLLIMGIVRFRKFAA